MIVSKAYTHKVLNILSLSQESELTLRFFTRMPHIGFRSSLSKSAPSTSSGITQSSPAITTSPNYPWRSLNVSPSQSDLLGHLEELYWIGVRGELENIIRTLRIWNGAPLKEVLLDEEKEYDNGERFIHGFDTFVDSVSEESRAFARRYGELMRVAMLPGPIPRWCIHKLKQPEESYLSFPYQVL